MSVDQTATIGSKIRKYREQVGLNQKELAEKAGVSPSTVSKAEANEFTPKPDKLQRIAVALGIPLEELIDPKSDLEIDVLLELASIFNERIEYPNALQTIEKLEQRTDLLDYQKQEMVLIKAESLMRMGEYNHSITILDDLRKRLDDTMANERILAHLYNKLGNVYLLSSNLVDAHAHYMRAFQISLSFPVFDELAAKISFNMGRICGWLKKPVEAAEYLMNAEKYFRSISDQSKLADTLFAQGLVYRDLERLDMAESFFKESLVLYKSQNLLELVQRVKLYLASSVTIKKEPNLALQELMDCAESLQEINSTYLAAFTYVKIAQFQLDLDQSEKANNFLEKAIGILPGNIPTEDYNHIFAAYFKVRAKLEYLSSRFSEAVEMSLNSARLFDKMGIKREAADSLEIAVDANFELGKMDEALSLSRKMNDILRSSLDLYNNEGGVVS